ncbi:asparagine synthase (glutamine-hydrolyzing) [Lichenihabitans sp. Uapishka_5]|uniref:asparagine synthase (glutamine-hydrolyzing) n=1 Tax=Lichenihabitans sp. Uapishka_5 TaxID=3037302 RepID=UPI0029E7DF43|nr:asparagine synthase (glutamine-hydrolyzing) [Lichenihabitans sp. Uapishka_5]MDX7952190.1 asparagine synthase (glutamine-hydrolyzing) [Lichenihabitans sp. Uapishka_5]
MCGIAGMSMKPDRPVDRAALAAMGAAIRHRGPDGSGDYIRDAVGFRHERLAIIDLTTGGQPLYDDGGRALVVNGEIYNYRELKAAMPDATWRTGSDCEPILALYASQGLGFVEALRGMYALALHDPATGRMVLARDPFGIKQLYYAETADGLVFASEPQALVAAGAGTRNPVTGGPLIRPEAVYQSLQLQFTTGAETIFAGVWRLLPGEILVVEAGTIVERRHAAPVLPALRRPMVTPSALRALDGVLEDTVTLHQRSDVPHGLFLSSGIDSAALLTAMARLNDEPVRTYTAAFPSTGVHDERETARALAVAAGARHTEVPITPELFWERLPEICAALDDPVSDYAVVPLFLLAERAARDVKVVLSGIGGDELLAGYRRYRRQMLPRWLGGRSRRPNGPCDGLDLFRQPLAGWRDGIAAAEAAMVGTGYNALQRAQAVDFVDWLPHSVLVGLDRCLMHFGLEGRTPLLDRAVADFAFPLPNGLKLKHGQGKYLLRQWLADANPVAEPFAKKLGFTVPVGEWIAAQGPKLGPLVARMPGVAALCRPDTVAAVFSADGKAHRLLAWRLLFFALWHRAHVERQPMSGGTLACLGG